MAVNEFDKVFLDVDNSFRLRSDLFGEEWDEVRRQQLIFLLERPLLLKVQTEKVWGPARLDNSSINEWWETEVELRGSNRSKEIEELADMALLFLTFDSLNPTLSLPTQKVLIKMGWEDTVESYCKEIELSRHDLIPFVENKIKINKLRNPKEAFVLVSDEDIQTSIKRMEHNWIALKKKRDKPSNLFISIFNRKDWWKKWLYVDEGGWVREKER